MLDVICRRITQSTAGTESQRTQVNSSYLSLLLLLKVKNDHRSKFSGKFTAMIILHFHLQLQFKNELFHLYFSSLLLLLLLLLLVLLLSNLKQHL